ncbi:MAG: serine hydrolase [Spirochaetales bacterium]|nr:serine hydrolase [Spirochaetales bacterium]
MTEKKEFAEQTYKGYEDIPVRSVRLETTAEEVGYNPEKIETLDRHFLDLVKKAELQSASYLLARKGKIFAWKAMGKLHYEKGGLYQPDSIRWIASITKLFTAISAVQLYERGLLDLYAPVADHIKEFDNDMHRKIKPIHLLTHTSGLRADGGYFTEPYMQAWNDKLNNWIEAYLAGPVQSRPGEQWAYSSMGYCVIAEIITKITGLDITEYIDRHILKPLHMVDSGFFVPKEKLDRVCYTNDWEKSRIKTEVEPDRKGYPPPAGGGLISTLHDMYRLGQCLLNNGKLDGARILSRRAIEFMMTNQLENAFAYHWGGKIRDMKYGVGVAVKKDDFATWKTFGHEGAGFSGLYVDKENDFVYTFYVPSDKGWTAESVDSPRAIVWSGLN